MVDGAVSVESFDLERVGDPNLRPLMQNISVSVDPATGDLKSPRLPVRFEIGLKNGDIIEEACEYPFGHPMNPAASEMVSEKFIKLPGERWTKARRPICWRSYAELRARRTWANSPPPCEIYRRNDVARRPNSVYLILRL